MQMRTCKNCGKEYDAHMYDTNGRIYGVRTSFCTDLCKKIHDRKQNNINRKIKRAALAEAWNTKRNKNATDITTLTGHNRPYGPVPSEQCFFCPLKGWACRQQRKPPCVGSNGQHEVYLEAVKALEALA